MPLRRLAQRRPAQLAGRGDDRQGRPTRGPVLTRFTELPAGHSGLLSARPEPDLEAAGYVEREYVVAGTAVSYRGATPADGHWTLEEDDRAAYATRVVVRRPASPGSFSGTLVAEWLNVSSGSDAAPDWTYAAAEILRRGHAWVGISAQHVGVEGGAAAVGIAGIALEGLKAQDRYAALHHPGDAFAYGIFTSVVAALDDDGGPLADLVVDVRLAVGESQSAYALTSYVNGVQPLTRLLDGFLVHSRGGAAMPLGAPGAPVDITVFRRDEPTRIRTDLDVPVIMVQTETDLTGRLRYLPARQPDSAYVRLWEVAGTAHADRFQIDLAEELLGCPRPVNRGQQAYVVRAALRRLDRWARGEGPAPSAPRLDTDGDTFVLDAHGNAAGGVRTPVVDAPVELLRGDTEPGASVICELFGSTLPMARASLRALWPDRSAYLTAYGEATDTAIAAGFVLPEDREAVLAEARPDLVDSAHAEG